MPHKTVTCLKCGWVSVEVSREYAVHHVFAFNEYFKALPKDKQQDYYGGKGASLEAYETCRCGGPYQNFRDAKIGDCPDGVTMGPIINRSE